MLGAGAGTGAGFGAGGFLGAAAFGAAGFGAAALGAAAFGAALAFGFIFLADFLAALFFARVARFSRIINVDDLIATGGTAEAALTDRRETSAHGKTAPAFSEASDPNGRQAMGRDVYQRIPKFILKMLKLVEPSAVKRPDAPSVSN